MVPFRQRCEYYSTVKFPRIHDVKRYKPKPKVDIFSRINRTEFDEQTRKLTDLMRLKILYEKIQPSIEEGFAGLNAILVVGGTGAGKSTLINSLLYGPNILEKKGKKVAFKKDFADK